MGLRKPDLKLIITDHHASSLHGAQIVPSRAGLTSGGVLGAASIKEQRDDQCDGFSSRGAQDSVEMSLRTHEIASSFTTIGSP